MDNSKNRMNIDLRITEITDENREEKLVKAARALSRQMRLGAVIDAPFLRKGNPNHDTLGRFTFEHGGGLMMAPDTGGSGGGGFGPVLPVIEGVKARTDVTAQNWGTIKNQEFKDIEKAFRKGVYCTSVDGRRVVKIKSRRHLTETHGRKRPLKDIIKRVSLMPCIIPVIQQGAKTEERRNNDVTDYEISALVDGGNCPVSVILTDEGNTDGLLYLSVMETEFDEMVAKSLRHTGTPAATPTNRTAGGSWPLGLSTSAQGFASPAYNSIIPDISERSIVFYPDLEIFIKNITLGNRKAKFAKALRAVSRHLGLPVNIGKKGEHGPEPYLYHIQQELSDQWTGYYRSILQKVYETVIAALGLPRIEVETMRKALGDSGALRYRGKVIYSPETGEPIKIKEFNALIEAIEKYLNRNTSDVGKRIVLDSVAIGKLLRRMAKYQTAEALEKMRLDSLKYRGKTFDWIRQDFKNLTHALGEPFTRSEMGRYQVAQDYVGQLVTRINDSVRNEIKDTVLEGIVNRRSRSQVSQDLFNRLGGLNRDWKRIADTEIVNTSNLAGILEEVNNAPRGQKVYFKRYELPGCCDKCAKVNGKVVLWSDTPLENDKIKDEYADVAIWEGKPQEKGKTVLLPGTLHPNCYSSDTEVMTDHGWKLFKDLLDNDRIMALNPETREIDFVPFVNRTAYEYNGKMIHFTGRNYDLSVTPDHNMLFVSQKGFYREALAKDLLNKRFYRLPRAIGRWIRQDNQATVLFGDLTISKAQYFRLWAWYLAEGNGRTRDKNSREVKIAQKIPGNVVKDLPELKSVLHEYADSVCLYGKYADPFKEMFGIYAEQKYIPQFIKDSSAENIREFLEAFSLADGTKRTRAAHEKAYAPFKHEQIVRTSSPRMAGDLCELITKAGWIPSVGLNRQKGNTIHFSNGDYVVNTDCYNINICKSKFRCFGNDTQPGHKEWHKPEEVDYNGMVYDVELERWHFLLVKRNGKCAWSGNCRGGWTPWAGGKADAAMAKIEGKARAWDAAVERARAEWRGKGIKNPNDGTPGYVDRINEIYKQEEQV